MPQEFDPYHRWLGIPPDEQPADHYRLLGLVRFENDIEVIRDAAERQIGHVRRYGLGKHSELSQRILNELAAAKACLMDPDDKPAYDAQLRKKIKAAAAHPPAHPATQTPAPTAPQAPPPPPVQAPRLPASARDAATAPRPQPVGRGGAPKWLIGTAVAIGLVLLGVAALALLQRGQTGDGESGAVAARQDSAADPSSDIGAKSKSQQSARPPRLAKIADQTATEGEPLEMKVETADRGSDPGPLLFSLVQSPAGAKIDAESGLFTWTPAPDQAAMNHAVTIRVVARNASELSHQVSFMVQVREAKVLPPTIPAIPEQQLNAGTTREVAVAAVDPNQPPRKLKYSLVVAPNWARIDEESGRVTLEPPAGHEGGSFRAVVRAANDSPDAGFAERSLAIVVTPGAEASETSPGMPAVEDLSGLAEIKGPSGPLDPSQIDMAQTANDAALDLMNRMRADPRVMPLFVGAFGGQMAAVVELNRSNKLEGVVIDYHRGKDPITCVNARLQAALAELEKTTPRRVFPGMLPGRAPQRDANDPGVPGEPLGAMASVGPSALQIARAQQQAAKDGWADVRVYGYLEFRQGDRHGKAATWDVDGQRLFWGNYSRGNRDGFHCLFENNRPRLVAVFEQGKKSSVYLLSNNRVEKRFAGEEEAQQDPAAQALLAQLDELESRFKQGERSLENQIKKTIQWKVGNLNQYKRFLEQMRRTDRDNRQKAGFQELKKAATFQD